MITDSDPDHGHQQRVAGDASEHGLDQPGHHRDASSRSGAATERGSVRGSARPLSRLRRCSTWPCLNHRGEAAIAPAIPAAIRSAVASVLEHPEHGRAAARDRDSERSGRPQALQRSAASSGRSSSAAGSRSLTTSAATCAAGAGDVHRPDQVAPHGREELVGRRPAEHLGGRQAGLGGQQHERMAAGEVDGSGSIRSPRPEPTAVSHAAQEERHVGAQIAARSRTAR